MKHVFFVSYFIGVLCMTISAHATQNAYPFSVTIDPTHIEIVRDLWGVPHIFAPTDAEVAYGLAWANAEDAFEQMQEALLVGKGMLGRVRGVEGAKADFFRHAIGTESMVERQFATDVSTDFLHYLEGYCLGVNAFAKAYPKRVLLKDAFPVTPKDVIQSYVVAFAFLSGVGDAIGACVSGDFSRWQKSMGLGSNAFALNSSRTTDGHTYLCTNPHFMVDGALSFYEAHLSSQEGLNVAGALFQGGASIFLGSNQNLGWGMTFNHFDRVDIYELTMHPTKSNFYEFDGKWCQLEERPVKLKVKIGPITIPVRRKSYWSVHGPAFKAENGKFYAVRAPSYATLKSAEQYYRMNKAQDFGQFKEALQLQGIPMFNIVYADKDDNLLYISNGLYPKREATDCDWKCVVPGNTSHTLWTTCHPVAEIPQVENPDCGYVFNCNNTPYSATCAAENPRPTLPSYANSRPGETNRSLRLIELLAEREKFDFADFKRLKFDHQYPKTGKFIESLQPIYAIQPAKYPDIAPQIALMQRWNRSADLDSIAPTYFLVAIEELFKRKGFLDDEPFMFGFSATEQEFIDVIRYAKDYLIKHFGTSDIPLRQVQRYKRSDGDFGVAGFADVMMANYAQPQKDGKYNLLFGDTYIHFADFNKDGLQRLETLLPFSLSSAKGKGYADQLELYNRQTTKPIYLDRPQVQKIAQRTYNPQKEARGKQGKP